MPLAPVNGWKFADLVTSYLGDMKPGVYTALTSVADTCQVFIMCEKTKFSTAPTLYKVTLSEKQSNMMVCLNNCAKSLSCFFHLSKISLPLQQKLPTLKNLTESDTPL